MKLMMTTAITAALIATGSFAETASRGADNVKSSEKVEMGTPVDATVDANVDKASRGDDDLTAAEAESSAVIADDEVAGIAKSDEVESRGAADLQGEEVTAGVENEVSTGESGSIEVSEATTMSGSTDEAQDSQRGSDEERSEEIADGDADADVLKAEDGELDASRGSDQARATEEPGTDVSDTMTSDTETSSRGADNEQGSEVTAND